MLDLHPVGATSSQSCEFPEAGWQTIAEKAAAAGTLVSSYTLAREFSVSSEIPLPSILLGKSARRPTARVQELDPVDVRAGRPDQAVAVPVDGAASRRRAPQPHPAEDDRRRRPAGPGGLVELRLVERRSPARVVEQPRRGRRRGRQDVAVVHRADVVRLAVDRVAAAVVERERVAELVHERARLHRAPTPDVAQLRLAPVMADRDEQVVPGLAHTADRERGAALRDAAAFVVG